jgi:uncharacterized membrane protein
MASTQGWLYAAWLALAVIFILVTGTQLPPNMASHFSGSGEADGFMARGSYLAAMCVFAAGLPALLVLWMRRIVRQSPHRVNLPNREYWMAPQRREATLRALTAYTMLFGFGLSLLIVFAHWEVVLANMRQPPRLAPTRFAVAIGFFLAATGVWLYRLYAHFRRRPRA